MIQVERLTKKFQTYTALNQISVSVQPGSVFGLVGSNGAGKSTLLRTIAGIYKPDSGTVAIDGTPLFYFGFSLFYSAKQHERDGEILCFYVRQLES